jgi:hypothetical protein
LLTFESNVKNLSVAEPDPNLILDQEPHSFLEPEPHWYAALASSTSDVQHKKIIPVTRVGKNPGFLNDQPGVFF